jgi:hypothetical protein
VAVARRPADDPARRVGTLFVNVGGPGDGEVHDVMNEDFSFSTTLQARFDIVCLDSRATGGSPWPRCDVPPLTPTTTLFLRSEQQFRAMVARHRAVGLSCLRNTGCGPYLAPDCCPLSPIAGCCGPERSGRDTSLTVSVGTFENPASAAALSPPGCGDINPARSRRRAA